MRRTLGTEAELIEGVRQAKQIGVDIAPFISVRVVVNSKLPHYGITPDDKPGGDWSYHPEFVPKFRPFYTHIWQGYLMPDENLIWQQDVYTGLKAWIDRGVVSFCWDVFSHSFNGTNPPLIVGTIEKMRAAARAKDPEATFSGETVDGLEWESRVLDYSWNWANYEDDAPITSVLRSPRLNCNVEESPREVKRAFADNLYLNIWTGKPRPTRKEPGR